MKTTLFYFSGTGNSLKVAKDLAGELGDTELIPIAKAIDKELALSADRIGIIFPVYMWGMPLIVNRFVQKIRTDKYVFAITTCGSFAAGTLLRTANYLKANGVKLSAGFVIVMPGNYIPMYGA